MNSITTTLGSVHHDLHTISVGRLTHHTLGEDMWTFPEGGCNTGVYGTSSHCISYWLSRTNNRVYVNCGVEPPLRLHESWLRLNTCGKLQACL